MVRTGYSNINITAGILKEELNDVPDEYLVTVEIGHNNTKPISDFNMNGELMELIIKWRD